MKQQTFTPFCTLLHEAKARTKLDKNIKIEIKSIETKYFVPLGIKNYEKTNDPLSDKIKINFEIQHQSAQKCQIEIFTNESILIGQRVFLSEITVITNDKDQGFISNKSEAFSIGKYTYEWDGFDSNGLYNSQEMSNGLKIKITVKGMNGDESTDEKEIKIKQTAEWLDVFINRNTKQINVALRVNLKDGGAKGLRMNCRRIVDEDNVRIYCPFKGRKMSSDVIRNNENRLPLQTRTKSFSELVQLTLEGLKKYWSRKVTIHNEVYAVNVTAIYTAYRSMNGINLRYLTNGVAGRSANPGSISSLYSFVYHIAYKRIYYNVGYIKKSKGGWRYVEDKDAEKDFMYTAAHEIGHEILKSFGRTTNSYHHKGTSTWYQSVIKNTPRPPAPNEIDLMKYSDDAYLPSDFYRRCIAAEEDVLGLLWLTKTVKSLKC